ncbi:hypothetical protein Baya_14343 [Bagarius yarrelli]|uniref:THD domain-containing protein n=1 Tax=Bagarius yarrelli TaxID=175774 RepID=A0A556V8W9_BAGYA|nr:hypothetical protein Baya_14343 [Bagarius yarrelli]
MANAHVKYPPVYVVNGGTGLPPPLPPKPGLKRIQTRRNYLIQNLLLALVCLALGGLLVEGCLIYQLHRATNTTEPDPEQAKTSAQKGEKTNVFPMKPRPPLMLNPSKPLAHLTDANKPAKKGIMKWNENKNSVLHQLKYRDGTLIIQKEGYYYVYSKLSYNADGPSFIQTVEKNSTRFLGRSITLLRYSRYNPKPPNKGNISKENLPQTLRWNVPDDTPRTGNGIRHVGKEWREFQKK